MENVLIGVVMLIAANGEPGEGTNKIVTEKLGTEVNVEQVLELVDVELNTGRVSSTGKVGTCWASPVYGSDGVKKVKIKCN